MEQLGPRYQLQEQIGAGGMALVYKANDSVLGRTVAIKVLRDEYATDASFLARFQQEARSVAGLSHPNIVTVYDVGQEGNKYFIVMEHVEGRSLKELIQQEEGLPVELALNIARQICAGLHAAHQKGVIHRDIKPQNILISVPGLAPELLDSKTLAAQRSFRAKITDFGIARALGTASFSRTGEVVGSVHYLSPEQAKGEEVTAASDLYAVGVVLYEMLTGKLPFESDTVVGVALQHIQGMPTPPKELNSAVPPALEAVVLRALAKNPRDRFPSAEVFEQTLSDFSRLSSERTSVVPALIGATPRRRGAAMPRGATDREGPTKGFDWLLPMLIVLTLVWLLAGAVLLGAAVIARASQPEASPTVVARPSIPVPGLARLDAGQAQGVVESLGLRYSVEGTEFSNDVPANQVLRQSPEPGTPVPPGSIVAVVISKGPEIVQVPSFKGLPFEEASASLEKLGLKATRQDEWNNGVRAGIVFDQRPNPNDKVKVGSEVTLVVSRGKEVVVVPDVVGKPEAEAQRLITQAKLVNYPFVNYQGHGELPDEILRQVCIGCVLSITPKQGTVVDIGTEIKMAVRRD